MTFEPHDYHQASGTEGFSNSKPIVFFAVALKCSRMDHLDVDLIYRARGGFLPYCDTLMSILYCNIILALTLFVERLAVSNGPYALFDVVKTRDLALLQGSAFYADPTPTAVAESRASIIWASSWKVFFHLLLSVIIP